MDLYLVFKFPDYFDVEFMYIENKGLIFMLPHMFHVLV